MFLFNSYKTSDALSAIKSSDLKTLKIILKKTPSLLNKDFEWRDEGSFETYDGNILHCATYFDRPDIVEYLIKEKNINVNSYNQDNGYTSLHFASKHNSYRAARMLIEFGASTALEDDYWRKAIELSNNDDMNEIINPGYKEKKAAKEKEKIIKDKKEKMKMNFYKYIKDGDLKELKKIMPKCEEFFHMTVEWDGGSGYPIHYAAWFNKPEIIDFFVKEFNIDVNLSKGVNSNFIPLHHAVKNNSMEAVKKLIDLGAEIDLKESNGKTAFDLCKSDEMKNVIIPGYKENKEKKEAYLKALKTGDLDTVKKILKEAPELLEDTLKWSRNNNRYKGSVFHMVASFNQPHILEFFIKEKGFDINIQEKEHSKWTALHFAVKSRSYEAARKLMNLGADNTIKNNGGYTAGYYRSGDVMREIIDLPYRAKVEGTRAYKLKGSWKKYGPEEIVHIYEIENFCITDLFNFRARNWKSITKDLKTSSISQDIIFFDNIPDKEILLEALKRHNEDFGGNIDKSIVYNRHVVGKQKRLG